MNRSDFLNKLDKMFPRSFTEENRQMWMDEYKRILIGEIDFDKMDKALYATWTKSEAPKPAQIKEMYLHDALINNDADFKRNKSILEEKPVPPPAHIKKQIEELKNKISMDNKKNETRKIT